MSSSEHTPSSSPVFVTAALIIVIGFFELFVLFAGQTHG